MDEHADGDTRERRDSSTNTDSDRVLVTKRAIFHALYELMEERDFAKLTVGDIIERAGVSRSTFYRCFEDKYDVVNWSFKRFKNIRIQDRDQYYSFESSLRVMLRYLAEHRRYFAHALRYTGQSSLRDFMYETNVEYMAQCWSEEHGDRLDYGTRAMIQFAGAGMSKIVERWVLDGCEQEVEDVAAAIESLVPQPLFDVLY
ncbi:TetR/AcrR family transcriptional regulator C-terminal domain-containing protein [Arabiibacter massiliensis]|uniref:TetR/AcrR family transcriptional regulator C-terminal domain-containing protein n=1 Tax=Arabiibacter massiliensis TaxID=1870985 RepID=UPI000B4268DC|nr:TetR/AcrR family transcriptional regulator C-terminal domain-containing protein [Arabiibacter massiliensis]